VNRVIALLIIVLAALSGVVREVDSRRVPRDFLRYHRAGRLVWTGRADLLYDEAYCKGQHVYAAERVPGGDPLEELEWKYAPATAVLMAPLGALHPKTAGIVWAAWNAGLIAAMFLVVAGWCASGASLWWTLVPLVILGRTIIGNVGLGQINPSAIVPATVGVIFLARGRDRAAGALVGIGTVVKFLPGVLALWFVWKRRWKALAACAGTVLLVGVILPAAVLGPSRSADITKAWLDARAHVYTEAAAPDAPGYSVKSFVYRVLGDTPYVTFSAHGVPIVVGRNVLPPGGLRAAYLTIDALLLAAAWWWTRGPLRGGDDARGPPESSILLAAILLVSPEARSPHFLYLALPLTALVFALVRERDRGVRWAVAAALCIAAGVALNLTSDKIAGEAGAVLAEIWCAPGWGALAVAAALVLLLRRPQATEPAPSAASAPSGAARPS
jgi:hypothetical protein